MIVEQYFHWIYHDYSKYKRISNVTVFWWKRKREKRGDYCFVSL